MPELTQEEKIKIFEKLPKELQDLMESEDTGAFLLYLEEKYNLNDEKVSLLSKLVGDVILGILSPPNLISEIISKLAVDQNVASQISQEINAKLFAPVANFMKSAPTSASSPRPSPDQYREPTSSVPEIIDLRKTPPPPMMGLISPAPIPPRPPMPPMLKPVTSPAPLIEAEPHLAPTMPMPPVPPVASPPVPSSKFQTSSADQYREPVPPNVLDLRKDKGEF